MYINLMWLVVVPRALSRLWSEPRPMVMPALRCSLSPLCLFVAMRAGVVGCPVALVWACPLSSLKQEGESGGTWAAQQRCARPAHSSLCLSWETKRGGEPSHLFERQGKTWCHCDIGTESGAFWSCPFVDVTVMYADRACHVSALDLNV